MIKSLLKIALILVVGILVYNRYFGTAEEKQQAKQVFGGMKDVVHSVAGVLKTEKAKFEAGKYDKVMDKLGDAYRTVREKAQFVDQKVLRQLDDLEDRKAALEKELNDLRADSGESESSEKGLAGERPDEVSTASETSKKERRRALRKEMEKLVEETEALLEEAQQGQDQ